MCHYRRTLSIPKLTRSFCTEKPVDGDYIGPPDPVSNLRPMILQRCTNETKLEKKYRETRESTQIWNHNFWTQHNKSFIEERKKFRENLTSQGKENITADEMSVFYKEFLDKNWKTHFNYNFLWYQKNISLLLLEFRVRFSKRKIK